MNRDEPLTPEERELLRLLGHRADPAPPAALDAAILAAARAAVDAPAQDAAAADAPRAPARRPRWPAVFGIAASMVFAIGLAWQLRPEPPPVPSQEAQMAPASAADIPAQAVPAEPVAEAAADVAAAAAPSRAEPAAEPAAPAPNPARSVAAAPPPPSSVTTPAPEQAAPRLRAQRAVADSAEVDNAPAAVRAAAPAAAAPAPPAPTYSAPAPAAAPAAVAFDARSANAAQDAALRAEPAREQHATISPLKSEAAASRAAPGVMQRGASKRASGTDVAPPEVLADAQLPRRQWLQKIRERRDSGQRDLARASLERYLQQYPEARLPRDLRPLLDD